MKSCSALLVITWLLASCVPVTTPAPRPPPQLNVDRSVDKDFAALAQATWQQFLAIFRARQDCFGDVRLRAAYQLDSRAEYDPNTATVTVRVPGTPALLQSALVHEWAHHVEFQCPAQQAMRAAFLAAQGLPPDALWRPANGRVEMAESAWAHIPSEQYAEATVVVVLGRREIPTTAPVTVEGVRVIAQWAAGKIGQPKVVRITSRDGRMALVMGLATTRSLREHRRVRLSEIG